MFKIPMLATALSVACVAGAFAQTASVGSDASGSTPGMSATSSDSGNMATGASSSKIGTGTTSHGAVGAGDNNSGVMGSMVPKASGTGPTGAAPTPSSGGAANQ